MRIIDKINDMETFENYKNEVLSKTTGANIHEITSLLGNIYNLMNDINGTRPRKDNLKKLLYLHKQQVFKLVYVSGLNDYEKYYCKGYKIFN